MCAVFVSYEYLKYPYSYSLLIVYIRVVQTVAPEPNLALWAKSFVYILY